MEGKKSATSARALRCGLIGSLLGTVAMDLVMVVESVIIGVPVLSFFALIGSVAGSGVPVGAVIHLLVASLLGLLFGLAVDQIRFLRIDSVHKGAWLGLLVGLVTIPMGCVPFALLVGVPILELVSFSFIPHLVWGAVMGVVAGYGLSSGPRSVEVPAAR